MPNNEFCFSIDGLHDAVVHHGRRLTSQVIESLQGLRNMELIDRTAQEPEPASRISIGSSLMRHIFWRVLHHPVVTRSALFLADALYRSDSSVGATALATVGALLVHAYRSFKTSSRPVRSPRRRCTLDA